MPVLTEELLRLKGHRWQVSCLAFSPDGLHFASGGWDKEIHVRNVASPDSKCTLKGAHKVPITSVCWQKPQGDIVCSGSVDCTAALWNVSTERVLATLRGHHGWVLGTSFSNVHPCIATASWDKLVRLWSPESQTVISTLTGHVKGVWSVDFHPRSAELCSGSDDGNIIVWDARSCRIVATLSDGHSSGVYCAAWSPDGSLIASGSSDTKACIWELRTRSVLKTILGHTDTIKSVAFNPQQQNITTPVVATAGGCSVRLSDIRTSHKTDIITLMPHASGKEVETVAISPDGTLLASGGRDGVVVLHNLFVPSVLPRSESYRSSSAFVRKSRTFSIKSKQEEDNEDTTDEKELQLDVAALDSALSNPKVYTRLKRLSRTEDKGVEISEPTEKRIGFSAKKLRSERSRGKIADTTYTTSHLVHQDSVSYKQPSSLIASETIASKAVTLSAPLSSSSAASHEKKTVYTQPVDLTKLKRRFELENCDAELTSSISQFLNSGSTSQLLSSVSVPSVTLEQNENENESDDELSTI